MLPAIHRESWTLRIAGVLLGIVGGCYLAGWTLGFVRIFNAGDDLLVERNFIFLILAVHILADSPALKWSFSWPKLVGPVAAIGMSLVGFSTKLESVVAASYALLIMASLAMLTPKVDRRKFSLAMIAMIILVIPGWMVSPPEPFSLQTIATNVFHTSLQAVIPGVLRLDAFSVLVGGSVIQISNACDGGAFFRVALAMAVYCSLYTSSWLVIVLRCALAGALAVLLNWLRLVVIGLLTYHGFWEFSLMSGHAFIGHVTFMVGIGVVIWFSPILDRWNYYVDRLKLYVG